MNAVFNRIAAGTVLVAAPVLIALGTAAAGHADTTQPGPVDQPADTAPAVPDPGLLQCDPGTWAHHQHQLHRGW